MQGTDDTRWLQRLTATKKHLPCWKGKKKWVVTYRMDEQMIGTEDAPYTFEYDGYYKILPQIMDWYKDTKRIKKGKSVSENFVYTLDNNKE